MVYKSFIYGHSKQT